MGCFFFTKIVVQKLSALIRATHQGLAGEMSE